jgi:hypothetical protein
MHDIRSKLSQQVTERSPLAPIVASAGTDWLHRDRMCCDGIHKWMRVILDHRDDGHVVPECGVTG